jgi:UDP-N-acetylmuramate dehydrogenase
VLVRDGGVGGMVIRLVDQLAELAVEENRLRAGGGASLGEVVSKATAAGIGGLEFLAGIPGSMGGAVLTNAGSRDVWVSHRLVEISAFSPDLRQMKMGPGDLRL